MSNNDQNINEIDEDFIYNIDNITNNNIKYSIDSSLNVNNTNNMNNTNKIIFEHLEALYNYVILWTSLIKSDEYIENINVLSENIYIKNGIDIYEFIYLLKNVDFRLLEKNSPKILYFNICELFKTNNLVIEDPFDVTIKLIAIGLHFKLFDIIYPNTTDLYIKNYMSTFCTYLIYTELGKSIYINTDNN